MTTYILKLAVYVTRGLLKKYFKTLIHYITTVYFDHRRLSLNESISLSDRRCT